MTKKFFSIRKELRPAQVVSFTDEMFSVYESAEYNDPISCLDANGTELTLMKNEIIEDEAEIRSYLSDEEARRADKVEETKIHQPSALKRLFRKIAGTPDPNDVEVLCDHWYSWREESVPVYRMFLPCYKESENKFFYVYRAQDNSVKIGETAESPYTSLCPITDLDQNIENIMVWITDDLKNEE